MIMDTRSARTVLVSHRIFPETLAALSEVGRVLAPNPNERFTKGRLDKLAAAADAFLAFMPDAVTASWLKNAPRLRMVAGVLKGSDNLDIDACTRRGVWVSNVPDLLTVPTAELAIGLMIGLARHIRQGDALIRRESGSCWRPSFYGTSISGSTVGIVGMGLIGVALAERLLALGARLNYFDQRAAGDSLEKRLNLKRCDLLKLVSSCDFLIVALPLNEGTYHLVNDDVLAGCKPGALLINPSRGSVVDERAVARALYSRRLGGYAADVFECEDLSIKKRPKRIHPRLLSHPNTIFTPHLGSAVHSVRRASELRAAANVSDWAAGRPPRDALNQPSGVPS
jgi:phosphonate dehydrogenase